MKRLLNYINQLSVGQKVMSLIIVELISFSLVTSNAIHQINTVGQEVEKMSAFYLPAFTSIQSIKEHNLGARHNFQGILNVGEQVVFDQGARERFIEFRKQYEYETTLIIAEFDETKALIFSMSKDDIESGGDLSENFAPLFVLLEYVIESNRIHKELARTIFRHVEDGSFLMGKEFLHELDIKESMLTKNIDVLLSKLSEIKSYSVQYSREVQADAKNFTIIVSLVTILAGIFIIFFVVKRNISRPLYQLTNTIDNFDVFEELVESEDEKNLMSRGDELGMVSRSFNKMKLQLIETRQQLVAEHVALEKNVEDRTAELKVALNLSEEGTAAKAAFLANMSHEIRTPMNGVIGMLDMLVHTNLDDDQYQIIRTVRESAYALLTIINDILDFSKIEAGKLALEKIPMSIRDTVEGMSETLRPTANKKGIRINIHVDPKIPDAVLADQGRIRQILFNIAGNAVKFTSEGRVLIRAYRQPNDDAKKVTVRFEVIDSGIGISKEAIGNLFQEFSQAESSTTRRFGGTGLGLSISQRLTKMMGGKIEIESELGKGSTFSVTLSFIIVEKSNIKSDGHDLSGLNVLFVADDVQECALDAKYLEHWGANITIIRDLGAIMPTALKAAADTNPFNIIVIGSNWSQEVSSQEIADMQAIKDLKGLSFLLMTNERTKADRMKLANVVYVESDPLQRASFIRGIAVAAGRASPEIEYEEEIVRLNKDNAPTIDEAAAQGRLILVAEDNPTNRQVIGGQLKLLGYAAEFFDDGKQALEAWASTPYAILLTDCHMPVMDGFELTKAIRKSEKEGAARFPIIAITASALENEVERCFDTGMDDFLAKPLEMAKLKRTLDKWMPVSKKSSSKENSPVAEADTSVAVEVSADAPIDPTYLHETFGDDEAMITSILKDYVVPARNIKDEIDAAFTAKNFADLIASAHKLKSSSRAVGAHKLADLCAELEQAGKADNWADVEIHYPKLSDIVAGVTNYIVEL